jgi:hypothetical protein
MFRVLRRLLPRIVSAGDEMKDVLRVRDRPTCTRLDTAECESKVELAVGAQQWEGDQIV